MRGPDRFERDLLAVVRDEIALSPGDAVVVGVSGGADSMALLAALRALGEGHRFPLSLEVAHVNHGLRGPASDADAAFVQDRSQRWGLPFHLEQLDGFRLEDGNLEERCRDARGAFLLRVAYDVGAAAIALAHTADDQAETVLHRLARGAGVRALAGMEGIRADRVIRPLLRFRRDACRAYLDARGIDFVEDASNRDLRFTRNRIRHEVLPALEEGLGVDVVRRLSHLADDLRVEADLADQAQRALLSTAEGSTLPVSSILDAGPGAGRLVHAWLSELGHRPIRAQVEALVRLARAGEASDGVDLRGVRVVRDYDVLRCGVPEAAEAEAALGPARTLEVPGQLHLDSGWRLRAEILLEKPNDADLGARPEPELLVDAGRVHGPLTVRPPRPGDRMRLAAGRRKLSDVFIDRRVPRLERRRLAVVTQGADIVWVPGVAVAADALPGRGTTRWARLRADPFDCRYSGSVVEKQRFRVRFG